MTSAGRSARVIVLGAGPAGLAAADVLARHGLSVSVFDHKPSAGRKFLVAGRGGLNLTHIEPLELFISRYGREAERFRPWLQHFGPEQIRQWARDLEEETFVGTSGRVFPLSKQAAPLLRRWLVRLKSQGVQFFFREEWNGLKKQDQGWRVDFLDRHESAEAVILALGGASWPQTGSDAAWLSVMESLGVTVKPFQASNCGWNVEWSPDFLAKAEGLPLKNLRVSSGDHSVMGELLVTRVGLEGGALYQLGSTLRAQAVARLQIDFKPMMDQDALLAKYQSTGSGRWQRRVVRAWRLGAAAVALLEREIQAQAPTPQTLVALVKEFPLELRGSRPIAEAISSSGGVAWAELNDDLMLQRLPGIFCVGEMLDWDAPTGGYLLTACMTTAHHAASRVIQWLDQSRRI